MRNLALFLGILAMPIFINQVRAEDCAAPCAGYDFSLDLENDLIFSADPSSLTSNTLLTSTDSTYFFAPSDFLRLVASVTSEAVIDPAPGESTVFSGMGSYIGELYASVDVEPVTLRAGKFDPLFSVASELAPGFNSTDLASAFDADERIGAELGFGFAGFGLNHTLTAAAFTTDRTILSESLFTNRGRTRLSDGGAGNTKGVSSFSVAISGCDGAETADCYEEGNFGYRLGFRHQKAGQPTPEQIDEDITPADEQAFLAAATKSIEFNDATLRLLGEAAYLRNFEGGPDNAMVLTASAALDVGQMRYVATYSHQNNYVANEPDTRQHLFDVEALYSSEEDTPIVGADWEFGAAYTYVRDQDLADNHMLSLRAALNFGGTTEFGK